MMNQSNTSWEYRFKYSDRWPSSSFATNPRIQVKYRRLITPRTSLVNRDSGASNLVVRLIKFRNNSTMDKTVD